MIAGGDDEFKQENVALFPGNNQLSETSKMMEEIDMPGVALPVALLSQCNSFDKKKKIVQSSER